LQDTERTIRVPEHRLPMPNISDRAIGTFAIKPSRVCEQLQMIAAPTATGEFIPVT